MKTIQTISQQENPMLGINTSKTGSFLVKPIYTISRTIINTNSIEVCRDTVFVSESKEQAEKEFHMLKRHSKQLGRTPGWVEEIKMYVWNSEKTNRELDYYCDTKSKEGDSEVYESLLISKMPN